MPSESPESALPLERPPKTLRSESFKNIAVATCSLFTAICVPVIGYWVSRAVKERETQGKFVELAITILREPPTSERANLRTWATEVINQYSGVRLNAETIKDLLEKQAIPAATSWESPSRSAKTTWSVLYILREIDVPFKEADSISMDHLVFWSKATSEGERRNAAQQLASALDRHLMLHGAKLEKDITSANAVERIGKVLLDPKAKVSDLANTVDTLYVFLGE